MSHAMAVLGNSAGTVLMSHSWHLRERMMDKCDGRLNAVPSRIAVRVQEGSADSLQLERGTKEEERADYVAKQLG